MCGIAGIINIKKNDFVGNDIEIMAQQIAHRGPDDFGFLFDNECFLPVFCENPTDFNKKSKIALAHKRLAIVDLSDKGIQPLSYKNETLWITSNSEIYNYLELKQTLINWGYSFKTKTDTEIILASYDKWGEKCVEKFNGMWSFCIYDTVKKQLFCSRDRFGVKPFYYYKSDSYFIFCSEIKGLSNCNLVKTGINEKAASQFLMDGVLESQNETLFKNIFELPSSHNLVLNLIDGDFKIWSYYELKFNNSKEFFNNEKFECFTTETSDLIEKSIDLRLKTDVSIGSLLSGGIDSSSILGFCKKLGKKPLQTYTCGYKSEIDEIKDAQEIAEYNQAEWQKIIVTSSDFINDFEKITQIQDYPLINSSIYAHYKTAELAKKDGIKVLLNGFGADELFGGYDEYIAIQNSYKSLNWFKLKLKSIGFFNSNNPITKYLNPNLLESYKPTKPVLKSSLNEQLHYDFTENKLKQYLRSEDRNVMALGIENRNPFADDIDLIEHTFNIAGCYKIKNNTNKYLLREAVKSVIPTKTYLNKKKQGFTSPHAEWSKKIKSELFDLLLNDELTPYLNVALIKKDKEKILKNNQDKFNTHFFRLISFAQWQKCYFC